MGERDYYQTKLRYQVLVKAKRHGSFFGVREMARFIGRSPTSVHYQLKRLCEQGYLARVPQVNRGYCLRNRLSNHGIYNTWRRKIRRRLINELYAGESWNKLTREKQQTVWSHLNGQFPTWKEMKRRSERGDIPIFKADLSAFKYLHGQEAS